MIQRWLCCFVVLLTIQGCVASTTGPGLPMASPYVIYDDIAFSLASVDSMVFAVHGNGIYANNRLLAPQSAVVTVRGNTMLLWNVNSHGSPDTLLASEYDGTAQRTIWPYSYSWATLSNDGGLAAVSGYIADHDTLVILDTKGYAAPKAVIADQHAGPAAVTSNMRYIAYFRSDSSALSIVIRDLSSNQSHSIYLSSMFSLPFFDGPNLSWNEVTNQLACSDGGNCFIISADGVILHTILHSSNPEWSSDGKSLAWEQNHAIMLSTDAGATSTALVPQGHFPHWSSHGLPYLSYVDSTVKVIDLDTKTITYTGARAQQGWLW